MKNDTPCWSAPRSRRFFGGRLPQRLTLASAIGLMLACGPVQAQQAQPESTMIKLIRGLMESGALKPEAGEALLAQARAEARTAQNTAAATPTAPRLEPGDVRVPYIPETVRDQIREEVKAEVMATAKAEGWAAPNEIPDWTQRLRVTGDVRVRNESRFYSTSNSDVEVDWNEINSGNGFDTNPNTNLQLPPLRNTRQDRKNLWRVRARLGVLADISENTQAGIRLATGNDDGPVSATQTLGGGLSKKDIWLDHAWLSYRVEDWLKVTGGRFANPYWSTETLFSNDLAFEGLAFNFNHAPGQSDWSWFATLGMTPLEYSSDDFPSRSQVKAESDDKWLNGLQLGASWKFSDDNELRAALAYYQFRDISGFVSQPCALYAGADACSSDGARPAFMQKGNTLMLLRDIALDPLDPANTPMPQYVGLASEFDVLDMNLRWDSRIAEGLDLRLEADYLRNMAYDENQMWSRAQGGIINNFGGAGGTGRENFESGDTAYQLQATLGDLDPKERGDWNMQIGYRRIEPDALPDAYNDSDFHLGGTNAKGYFLESSYALDARTWLTGRWFAAKEVVGPPLSIDVFQIEVNTGF
jgi:hypothetical protein